MNKSILLSVRPEWVAKILNGKKTIEIRKKFPKDYVGWVYIYCTKTKPYLVSKWTRDLAFWQEKDIDKEDTLNGKVVARFWCDNVAEYINGGKWRDDDTFGRYDDYIKDNIIEQSCLTEEELFAYCEDLAFSAIRISKLEIFDEPKALSEFDRPCQHWDNEHQCYSSNLVCCAESCKFYKNTRLTKAPQNYCYCYIGGEYHE